MENAPENDADNAVADTLTAELAHTSAIRFDGRSLVVVGSALVSSAMLGRELSYLFSRLFVAWR